MSQRDRIVAIMGATATGKSDVAIELGLRFNGEIVSMDSRQVYRGFDIGTGKVTPAQLEEIPHHLVDVLDPDEVISAGRHADMVSAAVVSVHARGRLPFLVGGTGLYFRAFLDGLVNVKIPDDRLAEMRESVADRSTADLYQELRGRDATRAAALDPNDRVRITRALELIEYTGTTVTELFARQAQMRQRYDVIKFVLTLPRADLHRTIARRTREMFRRGWVNEVKGLLRSGVDADAPAMRSLGYGEIAEAIASGSDDDIEARVVAATRQYAKRQETFFRGVDDAIWVDVSADGWRADMVTRIERFTL